MCAQPWGHVCSLVTDATRLLTLSTTGVSTRTECPLSAALANAVWSPTCWEQNPSGRAELNGGAQQGLARECPAEPGANQQKLPPEMSPCEPELVQESQPWALAQLTATLHPAWVTRPPPPPPPLPLGQLGKVQS